MPPVGTRGNDGADGGGHTSHDRPERHSGCSRNGEDREKEDQIRRDSGGRQLLSLDRSLAEHEWPPTENTVADCIESGGSTGK